MHACAATCACACTCPCQWPLLGQSLSVDDRRFRQALADHECKLGQELHALKSGNARKDDDMGHLVDGTTSQMAAAKEGIKAKQEFIRTSQVMIERLQAEVCKPGSPCMISLLGMVIQHASE